MPDTEPDTNPKSPDDANISAERAEMLLAHDLRSALTNVISGLQLLSEGDLSPASRMQLDRINSAADHLQRLLSNDMVVAQSGLLAAPEDTTETVALTDFVDDLRLRWGPRVDTPAVSLEFERIFKPDTALSRGRLGLDRLVGNLLENALKFTDNGPVVVRFEQQGLSDLRVSVRDSGPGFDPEALQKLFSFGGRPAHSEKEGTGLGLYIAKDMATRLGGTITVNSTRAGATVDVYLPDILTRTPGEAAETTATVVPQKHLAGLKVLLAEDNKTNQIVSSQMIETLGAKVALAGDGLEALALFEDQHFDLVVLDIEMPRKTGIEVMEEIRARPDARNAVPVVALTAYVMPDHVARIEAAGADMVIAKPLSTIDKLGKQLATALAGGALRPPAAEPPEDAPESGSDVIDVSVYMTLKSTLGDDAFSDLRIKLFVDLRSARAGIQQASDHGDLIAARSASHVMISLAGAIGAKRLQDLAQRLNATAHAGEDASVRSSADGCLSELDQVLSVLETLT